MKTKFLVGVISVLVVGALSATAAVASPRLWTDKTETTLLRSVASVPINQPDALEFGNNHVMTIAWQKEGKAEPVFCNEVEFGTTVLANNSPVKGVIETKLALPFGVAEGDNCIQNTPLGPINAPTYFDTAANGAVPATITITGGPPFIATIKKLKLSQNRAGTFCTLDLEGVKGELINAAEGFVEESPPNLEVGFGGPIPVTCGKAKSGVFFSVSFFLETMSTTTDTAFVGP